MPKFSSLFVRIFPSKRLNFELKYQFSLPRIKVTYKVPNFHEIQQFERKRVIRFPQKVIRIVLNLKKQFTHKKYNISDAKN